MANDIKSLPQNKEAEQAVLGSILLDEQAINLALEEITIEDFYDDNHRKIFSAMLDLDDEKVPIDVLTLYEKLSFVENHVGHFSYFFRNNFLIPNLI